MNTNEISNRQSGLWFLAAIAAPLAKAASGCSWPAVLILGGVTLLVAWWLIQYGTEHKPWLDILQGLWASVVISEMLYWCEACWPSHSNGKAATLILLGLCVWLASKGRERTARVGCILIWPVGLLLGLILMSAVPEIKVQNLYPVWQMPDASLVTVLLFTTLYRRQGKEIGVGVHGSLLCLGLVVSVITVGVLSPYVSGKAEAGVYELSRSISFFGVSQRLESVAAAGMTIGYFGGIGYLLSIPEETANRGRMVAAYGGLAGLLFLVDIRLDSRILAIGSLLIWVILPAVCCVKKLFQKSPKSA